MSLLSNSATIYETTNQPSTIVSQQPFNIVDIANLFIAMAILVAIVLSVYYVFIGGISFILSGGKEDKIKEAVNTIRYAIIGLIVTVFAVVFIYIIGNIFEVNLLQYINFDRIMNMLKEVFDRVSSPPPPDSFGATIPS
jgi:bacteriorhodopsin